MSTPDPSGVDGVDEFPSGEQWAGSAADAVLRVVDQVRDKTTGPAVTVSRAIVYGLVGVVCGLVALVLVSVGLVRLLDVAIPGEVWSAHLVLGLVFAIAGAVLWSKRGGAP